LTFSPEFGIMVVKDERLSNICFRKWFPFWKCSGACNGVI